MPTYRTVIHRTHLSPDLNDRLAALGTLQRCPDYLLLRHTEPLDLDGLRRELSCDVNTLPLAFEPEQVKLVVTDMDSTLIAIETIDEIAATLNLRDQVAAITEKAMAGELDFAAALKERVALLEGLPESDLEEVFQQRMKPALQPGAAATLAWLKERGIATALVSGGFTFFTDRLQKILPIDRARACVLESRSGRLTGRLGGTIVDGQGKAEFLHDLVREMGIAPNQTIAVGDGANDVLMLQQAGMGVAYHGHPIARRHADALIDRGDWHDIRYLVAAS
ncbi:MAG: phosphoserine phosphatase SerB [Methylothermaceae bacterium]|nr:phosphoserine phosphatase SerB [Methylothermaceae bacterium]